MTPPRLRAAVARLYLPFVLSLVAAFAVPRAVLAEKIIAKGDDWQVYTEGRVGGFFSWVYGDGTPVAGSGETIDGGGWSVTTQKSSETDQGTVNMMRVRSGYLANQLALGVRGQVTPWTTVMGYIQIWAFVESDARTKGNPNPADIRQGYAKLEGWWGSLIAGRTRTLFSRGATDINVLYAHKWGVGFPAAIDSKGPASGMVGFGVLGSGFAAGLIYGTPVLELPWWVGRARAQLNVGIFDPAQLAGGGWFRTKYPRAEAETTSEWRFGETGKVVGFVNGAYQKVYKDGYCAAPPCDETAVGVGYGGRFELGPVHLGASGHYGKGLGLNYALEGSYAALDQEAHLRMFDGYYVQSQFVVNKFDIFAGWGIARVFLTDLDKRTSGLSVIKSQMGINAGVVYNITPNLHWDLEYFRAQADWWGQEKQVLNCGATGMVFNW